MALISTPDTQENANKIAEAVVVECKSLGPPLLTTEDAIKTGSFWDRPPNVTKVGDVKCKSFVSEFY